ncbi:MAG: bifunctional adenosylcobinamide kinase/adenosylcobinamide-phosphate guanylyltransferase [Dehalococcoidia bacterium]|nr:bifunctional adenosylcobinamide kinase/adenosylcobinamide-phosphate guanylyltransferase [Dehalococcoidia bacterium]MSQ16568.1 bifunctional adenosylcobinamide kinase/adenosylcobinamide-phosphate guanylyltransferase [Dehalococcoidia bacterium]
MAGQVCLVLGGVRSGKSAFAEGLIQSLGSPVLYLATATAGDAEMVVRVRRHQARRPAHWLTLEEPLELAGRLRAELSARDAPAAVLVDSLDMWVSNLLLQHESETDAVLDSLALAGLDALLDACRANGAALVLVSGEVGLSLVPPYPLGRRFQDLLGLVNQRAAAAAQQVYLVVAGVAVDLKALAGS